jgi:hypothetical protein
LGIKVAPRAGFIFQSNLIAPLRQLPRRPLSRDRSDDLSANLAARIIPNTQIKIMPTDNRVQIIGVLLPFFISAAQEEVVFAPGIERQLSQTSSARFTTAA